MNESEPAWGKWGEPRRVRIDRAPVWVFARAVKDDNPIYASETAARAVGFDAVPAPPTFTFAMLYAGAFPDLQPPEAGASAMPSSDPPPDEAGRKGLFLHGEQHFTYHRQPMVGDVLEGRLRVSEPIEKAGSRGRMELTYLETRWTDLAGGPVVTERIVSVFLPEG